MSNNIKIGLEIHIGVNTETKLFCGCSNKATEEPNTRVCPTCLGHPGSKPRPNYNAILAGLRLAKALHCKIDKTLIFARKNYFYPDLSKNYQITQHETALGREGYLNIKKRRISITRVHIEEDPAALQHSAIGTLIDYNRSGSPLLEIVTSPEISSAEEAREFLKKLVTLLKYLEIFDEETGAIKADANISIKETDFTRIEIKNITGFKEIERALEYEIERQKEELPKKQETRGWNPQGKTFSMRTKEREEDYGYITDPDLVPLIIDNKIIKEIEKSIPELPDEKRTRFKKEYKIPDTDIEVIISDQHLANLYEKVAKKTDPLLTSKWFRREIPRVLNFSSKTIHDVPFNEAHLIQLISLLSSKKITESIAQDIMEKLVEKTFDIEEYISEKGLSAVHDKKTLEKYAKEALQASPKALSDVKKGEEKAINFLVGQVMRKTKGTANAEAVKKIVLKLINK